MKTRGIVTALVASLLVGGLAPSAHSSSGHTVRIKGSYLSSYSFAPKTLTVKRGNTVRWLWHSDAAHNVTFRSLHRHSKTRSSGSYSLRFPKRGTFRYLCTIHGFTGKIVVK
jgi:plastocyanin